MNDKIRCLYQIGEISKLCNIPIKTLRYYDEINLLKPKKIDEFSSYRYYSNDQLVLILAIKQFKEAGFSLKEIKQLLGREDLEYNQRKIEEKYKEIDDKINDLLRLREKIKFGLKELNKENDYEICGPAIDNYIRDIMSTNDPENYVTELLVPIK